MCTLPTRYSLLSTVRLLAFLHDNSQSKPPLSSIWENTDQLFGCDSLESSAVPQSNTIMTASLSYAGELAREDNILIWLKWYTGRWIDMKLYYSSKGHYMAQFGSNIVGIPRYIHIIESSFFAVGYNTPKGEASRYARQIKDLSRR